MDADFLPGNQIKLLNSGSEYFPALIAEIEAARFEIHLETYIYADDKIGHEVTNALCRAAARGLQVRVLVDGFGARNFDQDFKERLVASGVFAMSYRPELARFRLRRHRLRRLHRKLVVIDGRLAFVGGINVVDDNNAPPEMRPRFDYAVRIEGPILRQAHHAVRHMWEIVSWANFKRRFRLTRKLPTQSAEVGTQTAAFLIRDNIRHRNDILHAYIKAIDEAQEEILIANAYFLPGVRFGRALRAAAQRGVRIIVLMQGKTDHPLLRYATQAMYAAALAAGFRIFEYERSFMHAKVAVIDGQWATVGSSNIDPFSLLLAKEANVVVRDRHFAGELRASLNEAIQIGGREMSADELTRQPLHSRFLRWLSYAIVRALVGITGYGPKHWRADESNPDAKK